MTPRDPQRDPITLPTRDLTNDVTMRSRKGHAGSRLRTPPTSLPFREGRGKRDPLTLKPLLSKKRWWTDADQAELDVLVDAFVGAVLDHRCRCSVCSTGGPWCDALCDCLAIVVEFRNTRARRSEAEWLRAQFDDLEWERARQHDARMTERAL